MSKSKCSTQPFQIEGRFLGFVTKDGYKVKGLRLATAAGELYIKLSKQARAQCKVLPQVGTWLQVAGEQTINYKEETQKFKALGFSIVSAPHQLAPMSLEPQAAASEPAIASPKAAKTKRRQSDCILVCQKSSCCKRGGKAVKAAFEEVLRDRQLDDQIQVRGTGCMKQCKAGPAVVMPDKSRHTRVRPEAAAALVEQCLGDDVAIAG